MKRSGIGWAQGLRYFCLLLVALFGFITVVGSGGSSGSSDEDGGDSASITGKSGNAVDLNGVWTEACWPDEAEGESEREVNTISGSNFTNTLNLWIASTSCEGAPDIVVVMKGTFTLGDEVQATMGTSTVTATRFDATISSYQGTIKNADVVDDFNTKEECGFTDWEKDKTKELIDNEKCGPDETMIKDLMYVDDTVDPDLRYGSEDDGSTDLDGYPTTIDAENAASRS